MMLPCGILRGKYNEDKARADGGSGCKAALARSVRGQSKAKGRQGDDDCATEEAMVFARI
jgi:hypothetical protein